jgi:hypothetical protein
MAAKSSALQGVGLRLGSAGGELLTPLAVVRNVGNATTKITGRLPYTTDNGSSAIATLPDLHLSPGESAVVDMSRALREQGQAPANGVGGLEFEYSTPPGSVLVTALSVSGSGNQVFRVPMWDVAAQRSPTGGYPWFVDGNSSTTVYIKNTTNEAQQSFLQLNYPGGVYSIGMKQLEAGQTVTYDLRKLRDEQVPDNHGRLIPLDVSSGQVHWSANGSGMLIGRSEQADLVSGISSNYACLNCCGDIPWAQQVIPGSATVDAGNSYNFTAQEQFQDCYQNVGPFLDVFNATWTSSDPNVATADPNGFVTGTGAGSATISARWALYTYHYSPALGGCTSSSINVTRTATIQVISVTWTTPHSLNQLDGAVPIALGTPPQGSPAFVNSTTIAATGLPLGGTYSWSTSSNKVTLTNTTSATVTVTGSTESQSTRDVTITVTYTYNGHSVSSQVPFTVQKPTFMAYASTDRSGTETCPPDQGSGIFKNITWQLQDKNHNSIPYALPTFDTLTNNTPNSCFVPTTGEGTAPGISTDSGGKWSHHYALCSNACNNGGNCSVTGTQKYFSNGFEIDQSYTMSCTSITVDGH